MFTILKNNESAIKQVLKAAKVNGSIAAYASALITASNKLVTIICGDGSIELAATMNDCNIESEGAACVDAQKFGQAVAACKYECQVFFKDGFIEVRNGKSKFKLMTTNPDAYPSYPDTGNQEQLSVDADSLIAAIKSASLIAPESDVRYFLNGVKIGDHVCASDGHRLIVIDSEKTPSAIVPSSSIKVMPDKADGIFISQNFITVKDGNITFKSKLIDGKFPDVMRAVQSPVKFAKIDAESLRDAVRNASVTANKNNNGVRLVIENNDGKITSTSQNQEQSVIGFDVESSDQIEIAFNAKYALDAMSYYAGSVEVGFTDNQMIVKTDGMINVVMGMRL